jgi:hypothetical protein
MGDAVLDYHRFNRVFSGTHERESGREQGRGQDFFCIRDSFFFVFSDNKDSGIIQCPCIFFRIVIGTAMPTVNDFWQCRCLRLGGLVKVRVVGIFCFGFHSGMEFMSAATETMKTICLSSDDFIFEVSY